MHLSGGMMQLCLSLVSWCFVMKTNASSIFIGLFRDLLHVQCDAWFDVGLKSFRLEPCVIGSSSRAETHRMITA